MPDDDDQIRRIPTEKLRHEPGAEELASEPEMRPYLEFVKALLQGSDGRPQLENIRQLPLNKRYVWRITSSLQTGFADFDSTSVKADAATLTPEDFRTLWDLLRSRPVQFCLFLKAMIGVEQMEQVMLQAIARAKK